MARSQRLLDLIQELRRHRLPVSGAALADGLGISLRTLYRDIATLKAQGADIEGEPGFGYVLKPGFLLPPLMFAEEEIEALALGMRFVASHGDASLQQAAQHVLAKIATVLPDALKTELESSTLLAGPSTPAPEQVDVTAIRRAIRAERKLAILYADRAGAATERLIWPFALGFFETARVIAAWCELRQDFRHFRTDRIAGLAVAGERYPRRRAALLRDWRELQVRRPTDADRN